MSKEAHDIIKEMKDNLHQDVTARDLLRLSRLLVILADDAERFTRRLVTLTWALAVLTFVLLVFTVALYKDTHALVEHDKLTDDRHIQKQ